MAEYRRYQCGYAELRVDSQIGPIDQELSVEGYQGLLPLDPNNPEQASLINRAKSWRNESATLPHDKMIILRTPQEIGLPEGIAFDNPSQGQAAFVLYSQEPVARGNRRIPFSEAFEAYAIMIPHAGNMRRRIVQEVIVRQKTPLY